MFHFPGYHAKRSILFNRRRQAVACRIAPFRNLGIKVCLPLPQAYRSLPRPSSSCNAKASSVRPFTLDRASKSNSKTRSRFFALHFLLLQNPLWRMGPAMSGNHLWEWFPLSRLFSCQRTDKITYLRNETAVGEVWSVNYEGWSSLPGLPVILHHSTFILSGTGGRAWNRTRDLVLIRDAL